MRQQLKIQELLRVKPFISLTFRSTRTQQPRSANPPPCIPLSRPLRSSHRLLVRLTPFVRRGAPLGFSAVHKAFTSFPSLPRFPSKRPRSGVPQRSFHGIRPSSPFRIRSVHRFLIHPLARSALRLVPPGLLNASRQCPFVQVHAPFTLPPAVSHSQVKAQRA